MNMFERIINYVRESRAELRKVTWLSREDIVQYTLAVILVSVGVALFLGGVDFLFSLLLTRFVL